MINRNNEQEYLTVFRSLQPLLEREVVDVMGLFCNSVALIIKI